MGAGVAILEDERCLLFWPELGVEAVEGVELVGVVGGVVVVRGDEVDGDHVNSGTGVDSMSSSEVL